MIEIVREHWLLLLVGQYPHGPLGGLSMTLLMALATIVMVVPVSILLALALVSERRRLRRVSGEFARFVRGVPLLMFVFWIYFGIPAVTGRPVAGPVAMVVALVIYHAAYLAEILRAGIQAVPAAQLDAARTLGLGYPTRMLSIVLPQAFIAMAPSLILKISSIVKDTSVAYIISTPELAFAAGQLNSLLIIRPLEVFGVLAGIYFVLCGTLTAIANRVEKRATAFTVS